MNRQQAERKAMELYPDDYSVYSQRLINKGKRAAFMQCFDLMPTGSLSMTREEVEKWGYDTWNASDGHDYLDGVLCLYDRLASLSSAAPAPVSEAEKVELDTDDGPSIGIDPAYDEWRADVKPGKGTTESDLYQWWLENESGRKESAPSAPAPVGVTRETITELFRDFTLYMLSNMRHVPQADTYAYFGDTVAWVRDKFMPALTAPVSSAAQPATGYSEERGHSTNPNVQEKASKGPPISAPEWLNKHNSGG